MAKSIEKYDFLDWSEINENDRQHLQNVLFANPNPYAAFSQLPWSTIQPAECVQDEVEWTVPTNFAPTSHPSVQGLVFPSPLFTCTPHSIHPMPVEQPDIIQGSGNDCNAESLLAQPMVYIPNVPHNIYMNNLTPGVIGLPMPYPPPPQTMYHMEAPTDCGAGMQKNLINDKTQNPENETNAQTVAVGASYVPPFVLPYPQSSAYYLPSGTYPTYSGLVFQPYPNPETPIAMDKSGAPVVPMTYSPTVVPFTTQNYTEMTSNQNYSQCPTYCEQNEMVPISEEINPIDVILPVENTPVSFQQTNENSNETSSKVQNNLVEKKIFTNKESLKITTDNYETTTPVNASDKFSNKEFPALKAKNANFVPPKSDLCWSSLFDKKSHLHNSIQNQGQNNSAPESLTPSKPKTNNSIQNQGQNNSAPESTTHSKPKTNNSIQNQAQNNSTTESIAPKPEIKDRRSFVATDSLTNLSNSSPQSCPDPGLYRLGEFLRDYEVDDRDFVLQPRGLTNRSNWCYINSTLQALLACPPFHNLLTNISDIYGSRPSSSTSSIPILDSMIQLFGEFSPMTKGGRNRFPRNNVGKNNANSGKGLPELAIGQAIEPLFIYNMLDHIRSDSFKVQGRQEDAEEFLSCLLNALNDEMLEVIKLTEDPSTKTSLTNGIGTNGLEHSTNKNNHDEINAKQNGSQNIEDDGEEWAVMGPKNKSGITRRAELGCTPVSKIFRGQLCSKIHRNGDQPTTNFQPFFTLQLDIEKAHSVEEALNLLTHKDLLEGMTCSKTKKAIDAWKQQSIGELPQILLLHLKWFDYKMNGCSKIVKKVKFPINLQFDPKLLTNKKGPNSKERQYRLFAVVYHDGKEANKGHYITDAYHMGYGCWIRYDDTNVRPIHENQMLHPKVPRVPYILYYKRLNSGDKTQ